MPSPLRSYAPLVLILAAACGGGAHPAASHAASPPLAAVTKEQLRPVTAFDGIADRTERSRAIFLEATRVMLHPRCANCHPQGDTPLQGDAQVVHDPPVRRGPEDKGIAGLACVSCHQDHNLELARVPGAPDWHLAPKGMAWVGRTPHALCEQVKDPSRNGGRSLAQIVDHAAHDKLVAWGWAPGHARTSAPGSQEEFGALMAAWAQTGAECPR